MFSEPEPPFIVGQSEIMHRVYQLMQKMAQTDATVLVTGETGTGKEIVARTIHNLSARREKVINYLNCAALSGALLETELFGHDKGAFTGAEMTRLGRFELADQGTLLLDEISEVDIRLQAKLLRVIETGIFERVGSSFSKRVDVRIIATTNRSLERMVAEGTFRADLYFRLNILPINLPSLREHKDDLNQLVEYFMLQRRNALKLPYKTISPEVMKLFSDYDWPGNVRELFNLLQRVLLLGSSETITVEDIAPAVSKNPFAQTATSQSSSLVFRLDQIEREAIKASLAHFGGHRSRTAQALGITDRTLREKIKRYQLVPQEF